MMHRLMVVLSDRISDWVEKGELVEGYFNPRSMFGRIDVLLTNDDEPGQEVLRYLAGGADVQIHHAPGEQRLFALTFGYVPSLLRSWDARVRRIAAAARPEVVRAYGIRLNGLAAVAAAEAAGTPLVVSLHVHPERDWRSRLPTTPLHRFYAARMRSLEKRVFAASDLVLPVYGSIAAYLSECGVDRYEVVHNAVGLRGSPPSHRDDRRSPGRLKILNVGRQIAGHKDPSPILRAIELVPGVELTIVGDGPLHKHLRRLALKLGIEDRTEFIQAVHNTEVLELMRESHVFAYATTYAELSKSVIEAALSGLPTVHNRVPGANVPELEGGHVILVRGTPQGYAAALSRLVDDSEFRRRQGEELHEHARRHWAPDLMEAKVAEAYERLLAEG